MDNAQSIRQLPWFDNQLYPFESRFLEVPAGNLHYIDEGSGHPIVFVHGTPAWSFLYRNIIRELSKTHRCIAFDHIGFGLSDKPADFPGWPVDHKKNMALLMDHLGLDSFDLMVHDFGGPIGLSYALDHPEKIRRLIIANTWLWATNHEKDARRVDNGLRSWLGRVLYMNMNISPRVLMKRAFADRSKLPKEIHKHYTGVFPGRKDRYGLYNLGLSLVGASDWYREQWTRIDILKQKPTLLLWGMKDDFIRPKYLEKWKMGFANAKTVELDSGHFVQEEATEEVIHHLKEFTN